jgi:hypothetical protein
MVYQLPNGKVIQLTIEQYLDLTDEDIQYMMSINFGDYAKSPWLGSTLTKKEKRSSHEDDIDRSIDYYPEDPDMSHGDNPGEQEILMDDIPDIPDESTLD